MSSGVLTEEAVLQKTKTSSRLEVARLNLWGSGIENIDVLAQFTSLRIVSLTDNKITTLKPFAGCPIMQELYLRKNKVSDITEIEHLKGLKELRVLWIAENPIADMPNYRIEVIKALPQLYKLDEDNVTAEERMEALGTKKAGEVLDEIRS